MDTALLDNSYRILSDCLSYATLYSRIRTIPLTEFQSYRINQNGQTMNLIGLENTPLIHSCNASGTKVFIHLLQPIWLEIPIW